ALRPRGPRAHRAGDRRAAAGREGPHRPADRGAARRLAPNRRDPRAEHTAETPAAQPRAAGPVRDREGHRRGLRTPVTGCAVRVIAAEPAPKRVPLWEDSDMIVRRRAASAG